MSLEAGWYDDESDAAVLRYWDGAGWTPHTAPRPADAAPNPLPAAAAPARAPMTPAAPPAPAPAAEQSPFAPPFPSFAPAPAFDGIDESTTARPAGSAAPPPVAPAAFAPPVAPPSFAPPVAPAAFAPPVAPPSFAPPVAPPSAFAPPAVPFAPPVPPAPAGYPGPAQSAPAPQAPPAEFPSYTLPAPPGYAIAEQTTAPLPPAYGSPAPSGPQFSYEPYRTTGRTFIATWLFAMLLGFWGADRFYLGKIGTAIAKLLTLGGLGVWVLVDLLLVLTGAQRDRDGRPLEGYDEHKRTAWIVTGAIVGLSVLTSIVSGIANLLVG